MVSKRATDFGRIGRLALIGVGSSAAHYLQDPYNPGFLRFPTVVALHVVLGGVYLALAPFQFVKRIRSRHLAYHRRVGRLLVAIGVVLGATALFMGLVIPKGGWPERVVIGLFGTVFLVALVKGFVHVRAGRVSLHREWMIRAFVLHVCVAELWIRATRRSGAPQGRRGESRMKIVGLDYDLRPRWSGLLLLTSAGNLAAFDRARFLFLPMGRSLERVW